MPKVQYQTIALGGTFDHFHKGHERLILFAAHLAKRLYIGVTTPKLIQTKPFAYLCESYEVRSRAVAAFCKKNKILCTVIPLRDIYGPTLQKSPIEALCVTKETISGGKRINRARAGRGLPVLPICICDYYRNELGFPLHSQDIRAGSVNRQGKVYGLLLEKTRTLSEAQRQFFAKPQGVIKKSLSRITERNTFVVGDATLEFFRSHNLPYQLGIYDKKIRRAAIHSPSINRIRPAMTARNKPGHISRSLVEAIKKTLQQKKKHIFVYGEEDLATVALVLLLPLGAAVYYGQPGQGIVKIAITEKIKETFASLLQPSFSP
jgi:cytidyltransferase-like protein